MRALSLSVIASLLCFSASGHAQLAAPAIVRIPAAVRRRVDAMHFVNLPIEWRRKNWVGNLGEGSCVHAAMVHLFHWQGQHELADLWQREQANGESPSGLAAKLEAARVRFAATEAGDESFLEWAIRTRRGAAVVVQNGAHMVNLVGLDRQRAQILDSNRPEQITTWPRQKFLDEWARSGGWALTPVGVPTAPDPWIVKFVNSEKRNRL